MFQKAFFLKAIKSMDYVKVGKKGSLLCQKYIWDYLPFKSIPTQRHLLTPLGNKPFENTVGKGEIACYEQFLLFPVFSTHLNTFLPFLSNLKLSSANSFSLEESKICRLVMG